MLWLLSDLHSSYDLHKISGTYETIGGIQCYVATPQGGYAKDKVVLFMTDVLGFKLINNRVRIDNHPFALCLHVD